jgi:hypothetical protein
MSNTFHSNGLQANNTFDDILIDNSGANVDGISVGGNNFWLDGGVTNKVAYHIFHGTSAVTKTHGNQFQPGAAATGDDQYSVAGQGRARDRMTALQRAAGGPAAGSTASPSAVAAPGHAAAGSRPTGGLPCGKVLLTVDRQVMVEDGSYGPARCCAVR